MENGFGLQKQHSSVWMSLRDGDFEEEDVWDVLRDNHKKDSSFKLGKSIDSSTSVPTNLPSAARMIPNNNPDSNSSCNSSHEAHKVSQQSAPVNIPDWSKVYRTKSNKSSSSKNSVFSGGDDGDDDAENDGGDSDDEDEYGVGRTLKGRDLSKVRNAVLNKTGFLESL